MVPDRAVVYAAPQLLHEAPTPKQIARKAPGPGVRDGAVRRPPRLPGALASNDFSFAPHSSLSSLSGRFVGWRPQNKRKKESKAQWRARALAQPLEPFFSQKRSSGTLVPERSSLGWISPRSVSEAGI